MQTGKRIMLVGKSHVKDYVGARTQYIFNALTEAGLNVLVYDIDSSEDIPPNISATIFLNWIQIFDEGWARFMKPVSGKKILYTENWWWYDEKRAEFLRNNNIDLEEIFHTVAFSTNENNRWWPRGRCDFWGVCIDEDMAFPKNPCDYVYVDEIWPKEWSSDIYTASEVLDKAMPILKSKHDFKVISQASKTGSDKEPASPRPEWVDEWIEPYSELNDVLGIIGGAKAFFTSHEETLGLMQFEALMCGVPVITSRTFSKNEVYEAGEGQGVFSWEWNKETNDEGDEVVVKNVDDAVRKIIKAFEDAMENGDREKIRKKAVERFGKKAFVARTNLINFVT